MNKDRVGIVGYGLYIPETYMSAEDVAVATNGQWTADAVEKKLGFQKKPVPGDNDGTQEMGARAAQDAIERTGIDPMDIDLILCIGEEYKEYPLTTSGIYIQEQIGARNAWSIDIQQRCNTTVAALKMAKDMIIADEEIDTVMIVGGYRNGDFIDYNDPAVSFMFNLGAGAGAFIVKRNHDRNLILGTHIMTDGSLARDAGVLLGGTEHPIEKLPEEELQKVRETGNLTLRVFEPEHMKDRLNEVSMPNWFTCIDKALAKSGYTRDDLTFCNVLHFKHSMYKYMLGELGLTEDQSVYLDQYGHIGQIDQFIAVHEGVEQGKLKDGDLMVIIAAGIGYVWGATIVKWGPAE
ncbi:MAG: 3-oxoacyl-ACP synthase [Gammaproteobacteria bacterium]|nr:MAG: 3-oxoacyl-ACP synthase [Gammaproteobacteria bacterium]